MPASRDRQAREGSAANADPDLPAPAHAAFDEWTQCTVRRARYAPSAGVSDDFNEDEYKKIISDPQLGMPACYYHVAKLELALFYGDYEQACEFAERAAADAPSLAALNISTELTFYQAMALALNEQQQRQKSRQEGVAPTSPKLIERLEGLHKQPRSGGYLRRQLCACGPASGSGAGPPDR